MKKRLFTAACLALLGCRGPSHPPSPPPPVPVCDTLAVEPQGPIDHGRLALAQALGSNSACIRVVLASDPAVAQNATVALPADPEGYVLFTEAGTTWVVGGGEAGAMYGAFELAEQLELDGPAAVTVSAARSGQPELSLRGANLFLTLPEPGEPSWWFDDDAFWDEYLDLLMRARLNFLDLHAMYNAENTLFPNALPYFARSVSHPEVGVPPAEYQRNLARLKKIVAQAQQRGIRVGLMTYQTDLSLLGGTQDWALDDAANQQYTREAAEDLARQVPQLWRLGFRIGESTHPAVWYRDSFVQGVRDSGTSVRPYTRSWWVPKADMLALVGDGADDYLVEAKFNGEHLAAPYAIAGGYLSTPSWSSYSYEDYLDAPAPWKLVFQVRSAGTHHIFRYASLERTRRALDSVQSLGAAGFSLEAPHAYATVRDTYHRPGDAFSAWTFRRDELMYLLFGRLAYRRDLDARPFQLALKKRLGTDATWAAMQAASEIVPWIQQANSCGADIRQFAPELELGGTVAQWAQPPGPHTQCAWRGPFDAFAIASPYETARDLAAGRPTARLSPIEVAHRVLDAAAQARAGAALITGTGNPEARDVARELTAQADLGEFFAHRLRAATALAVHQATADASYLAAARTESATAVAAFGQLAADTGYIVPFDERMRMLPLGLSPFHWSKEVPLVETDATAIDDAAAAVVASPPAWTGTLPPAGELFGHSRPEGLAAQFSFGSEVASLLQRHVAVTLSPPPPPGASVSLLWKRFADVTDFAALPMSSDGGSTWEADVTEDGPGGLFAVEVTTGAAAWRLPDVTVETPYRVIPAR